MTVKNLAMTLIKNQIVVPRIQQDGKIVGIVSKPISSARRVKTSRRS